MHDRRRSIFFFCLSAKKKGGERYVQYAAAVDEMTNIQYSPVGCCVCTSSSSRRSDRQKD